METELSDSAGSQGFFASAAERLGKFGGLQSDSKRSGKLNSLDYGLLTYPSDLGSPDSGSGILNWIEFTTYAKESGSLSSVVKEAVSGIGNLGSGVVSALSGDTDSDSVNSETAQTLLENAASQSGSSTVSASESRLGAATTKTGDQVSIYLPGGIEYTDELEYETKSFAGLKNLTNLSAVASLSSLNLLRKVGAGLDKVAGIVGQESLNVGDAISASLGVVANPRKELLFQGVKFRSFDFKFVFIPRSSDEAQTVAKIIKMFRFHAYPELSANAAFFQFPSEFGIKFKTVDPRSTSARENPSLPKLRRCFLSKITTNFTPDDVYYSFQDGSPPKVEMTLSFQESDYIHRNLVKEGY